jgi:predicted TIM-barrel fold metal-dependent hydrolase
LEEIPLSLLPILQLATVTLGCLIILASLLAYRVKFLDSKKSYVLPLVVLVFAVYFVLVYVTYIKAKYPNNIILKPHEISKVFDLILGRGILLSDYKPEPILVVKRREIKKAKYPVIDVHFHMASSFATEEDRKALAPETLIETMDLIGVRMIVNLDGGGRQLEPMLDRYQRKYPDRFLNFSPVYFPPEIVSDDFLASRPAVLEEHVKKGARGLKLWKYLGLKTMDTSGKVIPPDDARLDPLWAKAGELGIPVLWHMGDPAPFFQPINRFNERYEELRRFPDWSFYGPRFPIREALLKQRENVLRKHPNTIIIGAHMGDNADDLSYIAYLLDTYPNYYVEISSRLPELGREPNSARRFFIKYQDRILFGTDGGALIGVNGWSLEKFYRSHFEFLETDNEYFDYPMQGAVNQGRWKIYGINLPDEVLEKIYYKNAEKILFKNKNK